MALVDEIGTRLSSQGVGGLTSTAAWRISYWELLPGTLGSSSQAQNIAIVPTGGFNEEYAEDVLYPTFQVIVRGASTGSTGLEAKMDSVVSALNLSSGTWNGRTYLSVFKQGDRVWLGRDGNQRPMLGQNFMAFRSRST